MRGDYLCGRRLYETMLVWRRIRRCATTSPEPPSPTSGAAIDRDVSIGGAGWPRRLSSSALSTSSGLFRYPVVIGGGTPFLSPVTDHIPLDLIETRTFGSRVGFERYRRAPAAPG